MRPKITPDELSRINSLLSTQNAAIHDLHLFSDQDQNDSLTNRSHLMRDNYKYLQKISRAEEMVRTAKEMGEERIRQVKLGVVRKNGVGKGVGEQVKNPEMEGVGVEKKRGSGVGEREDGAGMKERPRHSSFVDRKVEEQISRIEETKRAAVENSSHVLPKEIIEGDITKSIVNIDPTIAKNYFKPKMAAINASTSPQQIYRIMNPFYQLCGIPISLPLIKKYKNCAYFGSPAEGSYEGFLILHQQEKLYYGQMENEKKNGRGTEIDFRTDTVYVGNFLNGRKEGVFTVMKPKEKYVGQVSKGEYHGQGELTTAISVYKGRFMNGMRHGQGEQTFTQMGLTICGTFINNKFTNNSEKQQQSRLNTINSKSQAPSHKSNTTNRSVLSPSKHFMGDTNVVFEPSAISRQNYQEFDCQFGDDSDSIQGIQRKVPAFRIKQARPQRKKQETSRPHSILKN